MAVLGLGLCTFTAMGLCSDPGEPRSHKSQGMARKQTKPRKLNKIKNCSFPRICMAYFQFSSVPQLCPTLCDSMNHSMPGLPVHHQLLEFTQTHVHRVSDAIQPSHPLLSPSPPAPNPSQHQSFFQ